MDFNEYQNLAARTGHFDKDDFEYQIMYTSMGLAGESGELIEKIKKVIRNDKGVMSEEKRDLIRLEIGDVLWYLSQISRILGISFQDAAEANIRKLEDRVARNVLLSEGDTR